MMSDRPIGVMLSGGIDSGAIVALMAERSSQVKTFTVGFEGGGDADETPLARQTAQLFGTEHHELIVGRTDFASELPSVIDMLEEPVGTSSALGVRVIARLARKHVPVLLCGQGADELLAGYWRYIGEWLARTAFRLPPPFQRMLPAIAQASRYAGSVRLERGLRALEHSAVLDRFMNIYAVFTERQKRKLYGEQLSSDLALADNQSASEKVEGLARAVWSRDSLDQMLYVDLRLWLPDDLLLVADKMAMAESVELRVPFLDPAVVSFVESLPSSYKLRYGRRKAVEKEALRPLLPREIIHRKERGFATPIAAWLRTSMSEFAQEVLLCEDAHAARLFRRAALESMLERHRAREVDYSRQIFLLLSLELWARRFLS
jgi:asparagine synthase (glutamine-hydrolysing)